MLNQWKESRHWELTKLLINVMHSPAPHASCRKVSASVTHLALPGSLDRRTYHVISVATLSLNALTWLSGNLFF